MIVDSHVHLLAEDWIGPRYLLGLGRQIAAVRARSTGIHPSAEEIMNRLIPAITDTTGEKTVAHMDQAGVDRSCVFALDMGPDIEEPPVSIEDRNRIVAEAAVRFPDRLIPFLAIDPRRPGGLDHLRRGVEEWGMRGLKLYPPAGFYPYDPVVYPYYEYCAQNGIPVLIHTGTASAPMKFRFAQPTYVDDVAADFPDLPIIMAHVSHHLWEEALGVATVKPRIYVDFSGWQFVHRQRPQDFYRMLRKVIDELGPWRVFFATDGPFYNPFYPWGKWVKAITEPDLSSCPEVSFTPEETEIIMGVAFSRLLQLEG